MNLMPKNNNQGRPEGGVGALITLVRAVAPFIYWLTTVKW